MSKPKITLHLGVHKTATTHIQSRLANSMDMLRINKLDYIPLYKFRKGFTSQLHKRSYGLSGFQKAFPDSTAAEHLILSDENILGGVKNIGEGLIYKNAQKRIKKVLTLFKGYDVRIFVTVRNYSDYYVSRYVESLRHHSFNSFEAFYSQVKLSELSWLDTLNQIKSVSNVPISVVDFNDLISNETGFFEKLLGVKGLQLSPPKSSQSVVRAKFSLEAYEIIKLYAETYSVESSKKLAGFFDVNPQKEHTTPFSPFYPEFKQILDDKYRQDLELIKSQYGLMFR